MGQRAVILILASSSERAPVLAVPHGELLRSHEDAPLHVEIGRCGRLVNSRNCVVVLDDEVIILDIGPRLAECQGRFFHRDHAGGHVTPLGRPGLSG